MENILIKIVEVPVGVCNTLRTSFKETETWDGLTDMEKEIFTKRDFKKLRKGLNIRICLRTSTTLSNKIRKWFLHYLPNNPESLSMRDNIRLTVEGILPKDVEWALKK